MWTIDIRQSLTYNFYYERDANSVKKGCASVQEWQKESLGFYFDGPGWVHTKNSRKGFAMAKKGKKDKKAKDKKSKTKKGKKSKTKKKK